MNSKWIIQIHRIHYHMYINLGRLKVSHDNLKQCGMSVNRHIYISYNIQNFEKKNNDAIYQTSGNIPFVGPFPTLYQYYDIAGIVDTRHFTDDNLLDRKIKNRVDSCRLSRRQRNWRSGKNTSKYESVQINRKWQPTTCK